VPSAPALDPGLARRAWDGAVDSLRERGWLTEGDDLRVHRLGRGQRQEIEDQTDALAAAPYAALGEERLRRAARPGPPVEHVFAECSSADR
jgi:hypothetical protein